MTIVDQAARQEALDTQQSIIVQAPAGSGKTELLTQRFLALLATVPKPENIIALTFTRKAANEMRQRILHALQRAVNEPQPKESHAAHNWQLAKLALACDQAHQWQLLQNPNRLRIQTLDALCANLCQQMPVVTGLYSQPAILEDPHRYYEQAANNLLADLEETDCPWQADLINLVAHCDNRLEQVQRLFIQMLSSREQWLSHIVTAKQASDVRPILENALENCLLRQLKQVAAVWPDMPNHFTATLRFAARTLQQTDPNHPLTHYHDLSTIPPFELEYLSFWQTISTWLLRTDGGWRKQLTIRQGFPAASSAADKEEKQWLTTLKSQMLTTLSHWREQDGLDAALFALSELPNPQYAEQQWQILQALFTLLPVLVANLTLLFRQQNVADFSEISQAARLALGEPEQPTDLSLKLDHQIQHLLIDEFQDTSLTQFELLTQLTAGWQPNDGRSLFIVGDPMQSIYRFREAQVSLFLQVQQQGIGQLKPKALRLKCNFRSEPGIVNWVNHTFEKVFPKLADANLGAIPFHASTATRQNSLTKHLYSHGFMIDGHEHETEAEILISQVQKLQQCHPDDSIAILVKARQHLAYILPLLQQHRIDFVAHDIDSLSTREVISDLMSLTHALCQPIDRTAWLAILRAPWCGLCLADLLALAEQDSGQLLQESLWQYQQITKLSTDGQQRLSRVMPILQTAVREYERLPFATLVENTWLALGGPACIDEADLKDVEKFFEQLLVWQIDFPDKNPNELNRLMHKLYASVATDKNCQVHILTMHKAKGLEFDHVLLPGLCRRTRSNSQPLLLWHEQQSKQGNELLLAPLKAAEHDSDAIYRYLWQQNSLRDRYESARLLYVAATRAKRSLHLFFYANSDEAGEMKAPSKQSLGAQLWPLVVDQIQWHESTNVSLEETPHQLKRLPADWTACFAIETADQLQNSHEDIQALLQSKPDQASLTGTLLHQALYLISQGELSTWLELSETALAQWVVKLCQPTPLTGKALITAQGVITQALRSTLRDPKGQWILQAHQEAESEMSLQILHQTQVRTIRLDRTFIDEQGTRWIIDYKSTDKPEEELEKFLQQAKHQHQAQLAEYTSVWQHYRNETVRCGLYYPVWGGWIEW